VNSRYYSVIITSLLRQNIKKIKKKAQRRISSHSERKSNENWSSAVENPKPGQTHASSPGPWCSKKMCDYHYYRDYNNNFSE
jgi:hypothetical protein